MNDLLVLQFEQFWRIFSDIVKDYDELSWKDMGHCLTKPSKLSFHIIQSVKFYMDDRTDFILFDGRTLSHDQKFDDCDAIITQNDIINLIEIQRNTLKLWLNTLDIMQNNDRCNWTGENMESVVLFLIRHSNFHLGEINALLNEFKHGGGADHFAKNIY